MLGQAARVPRHTSRLPRLGNENALQSNWFLTENLQCTGPATHEPGCPGITNDTRFARPGKPAGLPGSSVAGFNGPLSGTTRVSRYQKWKTIWILLKQETVSCSGISWAICKSAPHSRQITTPAPHHSVFYRPDALPATQLCSIPKAAL